MANALTETVDGSARRLPNTKFYVPGSVLEASVDNTLPIAYGLPPKVDMFYMNSPAFRLQKDAGRPHATRGVVRLGRTAAQRMGLGTAIFERRAWRRLSPTWARGRSTCSARRSPSAASRTERSSSCSTPSIWREREPVTLP